MGERTRKRTVYFAVTKGRASERGDRVQWRTGPTCSHRSRNSKSQLSKIGVPSRLSTPVSGNPTFNEKNIEARAAWSSVSSDTPNA